MKLYATQHVLNKNTMLFILTVPPQYYLEASLCACVCMKDRSTEEGRASFTHRKERNRHKDRWKEWAREKDGADKMTAERLSGLVRISRRTFSLKFTIFIFQAQNQRRVGFAVWGDWEGGRRQSHAGEQEGEKNVIIMQEMLRDRERIWKIHFITINILNYYNS